MNALLFLSSAALLASPAVAGDSCSAKTTVATTVSLVEKNIVDTAVSAGNFKTLAAALGAADLVGALQSEGPFTVFAPTDEAFAKLPKGTVETLLKPENKARLASILTYHVVPGAVMASDVVKLDFAGTLNGQRVSIEVGDRGVTINGAKVVTTDIECSNGVIHVIDSVILPAEKNLVETAIEAGSFKTLTAALSAAGLVDALKGDGPFTVFAPTDAAFAALPEGTLEKLLLPENKSKLTAILEYHVVAGRVFSDQAAGLTTATTLEGSDFEISKTERGLMIDGAKVVTADIQTSNGVIHVINKVILPN